MPRDCNDTEFLLDRYDLNTYMQPYWRGRTVCQEAVLVLADAQGRIPDISLLYEAQEILCVRSSDLKTVYLPGRDYLLEAGKLRIPEGSAVPVMAHDVYYPAAQNDTCKRLNETCGEGYIFFSEGALMHSMQIAVTYTHRENFAGPVPACKKQLLPQTTQKLKTGKPLQVCIFGDSISVGGNSSGFVGAQPMAGTWWQMVTEKLQETYPDSAVSVTNPSVGGKTSEWGVQEAVERVGYGPDLCIIGFGMNDGTKRIPPETYGQNIRAIMAAALKGNPACEFVLLATILPNGQVGKFLGHQQEYLPVLQTMEKQGVAVADMTTFHKYLLSRKRYCDMSGNNVNHPNDFLARAYGHVVWQTVIGYKP